ncbi:hypothetical protein P7K49_032561, partial [Saguinus oedipus]
MPRLSDKNTPVSWESCSPVDLRDPGNKERAALHRDTFAKTSPGSSLQAAGEEVPMPGRL